MPAALGSDPLLIERYQGQGQIAIIAPEDLLFGLGRLFASRATLSGIEASAFRTAAEAWVWLECAGERAKEAASDA